jgi:hypothetical protein
MKKLGLVGTLVLLVGTVSILHADRDSRDNGDDESVVVTSSNLLKNSLLVYDSSGALLQTVSTLGKGGVGGNAGGIATRDGLVAVVNFGSQSVSLLTRGGRGFEVRQVLSTISPPVSVAFGHDHLYVLGTTTVESHRLDDDVAEHGADGVATLVGADGSAAQVGVSADQLVMTEKSGIVEVANLQHGGAVEGPTVSVPLPADVHDTPLGLTTRGDRAYVTIAHSDVISLIRDGKIVTLTATGSGFPTGPGQQAPCWLTLSGPFLFSSNSPSHTISRLIAVGRSVLIDQPVAAPTNGAPTDIASTRQQLAVIESDSATQAHITFFRMNEDGDLVRVASTAIASPANGIGIVGPTRNDGAR